MRPAAALACALILGAPASAQAGLCAKWGTPAQAGLLDPVIISEASGLEASARFPGRLYHNNDSGDGLRFYITDMAGARTTTVELAGPHPTDIEEMSLGPCGQATCLYLGDIGDNPAARSEVVFTLVEEAKDFAPVVTPLRAVRARYPDGPHNAEAFAVLPNGDLVVITKPADRDFIHPGPALVFKLTASQLAETEGVQVFAKVGELDLPKLLPELPFYAWVVTGLDIAADGRHALVLTYGAVIELNLDLSKPAPPLAEWRKGETWQVLRPPQLQQQEAIAWQPDERAFVYDTETGRSHGPATLMKVACEVP